MSAPILYGPDYSTYVRTARMAMSAKDVAYDLKPIDFLHEGMSAEQLARHPFGKVPALDHDGFGLYETGAITRYIDESWGGVALQPADVQGRARMTQIIAILDSYAYMPVIWGIAVERLVKPSLGQTTDEATIAAATPKAKTALLAVEALAGDHGFLVGNALSLADLHLAPILAYFTGTPEWQTIAGELPKLSRWWTMIQTEPSYTATAPAG